jgi:hypothetical protein
MIQIIEGAQGFLPQQKKINVKYWEKVKQFAKSKYKTYVTLKYFYHCNKIKALDAFGLWFATTLKAFKIRYAFSNFCKNKCIVIETKLPTLTPLGALNCQVST